MRDRREAFKKEIKMPDVLEWIGKQVNLTVIEQGRKLENPPALEFLTAEGVRLVISPLSYRKLRWAVRKIEGKTKKVAKLVEPLFGTRPGKVQVVERSNRTVHEWYEVEIETAAQKLNVVWLKLDRLYFYMIPNQPVKQGIPLVSFDLGSLKNFLRKWSAELVAWFKQRMAKQSG